MPQALTYHRKVADHFKEQKKTWDFFAAANTRNEQLAGLRLELLKNTYKFTPEDNKELYEKVEQAKTGLGLHQLSVSVYQAQFAEEVNATIVYMEGEAHIVFSGALTQLLDEEELLAVIAHELTHIKLFTLLDGDLEVADRIIAAIANHHSSEAAYYETARLFRLYTEIFCDRGAYTVVGSTAPVITSLVKIATGLQKVSAASYVAQAEEIFQTEKGFRTHTITHPENFIRARAIQLWHDDKERAEKEIVRMIEGVTGLDALDIFKQKELASLTIRFLQLFLKPNWFRTVPVMSQARQFFPDFIMDETALVTEDILSTINDLDGSIKDYLCYLLLDFVLVDARLELVPFGWAYQFAEELQLKEPFDALVRKELKLSEKKLQQHRLRALAAYYEVKEGAAEQIYEA